MIRLALLLALTAAAETAAPAAAETAQIFRAAGDLPVQPTGSQTFSVIFQGQTAPTAFWCAAGDYVMRGLGKPSTTLIYRASAVPRKGGQAISFSLNKADNVGDSGLLAWSWPSNDGGVIAGVANGFCFDSHF